MPGSPPKTHPPATELLHAVKDSLFDKIYPHAIQEHSSCHWSPVNVCRLAAKWLVERPGTRVLDMGCGPGKFCIIGATTTQGRFTGIEQRTRLARAAQDVIRRYALTQVNIIAGNITEIDFLEYDAFYLFNPFEENVFPSLRIDFAVELEPRLYTKYINHVQTQLVGMPVGTRVVTYCGDASEIPAGYECQQQAFENKLKLWVKTQDTNQGSGSGNSVGARKTTLIGRGSCGLVPT